MPPKELLEKHWRSINKHSHSFWLALISLYSVNRCWGCLPNLFFPPAFSLQFCGFRLITSKTNTSYIWNDSCGSGLFGFLVCFSFALNQFPGLLPLSSEHQEDFSLLSVYWSPYWKIRLPWKLYTLVLSLNVESHNGWLLHLPSVLMASMWWNKCFNNQYDTYHVNNKHWWMKLRYNKILTW